MIVTPLRLGVLAFSAEYSTGLIRVTFTAAPRRRTVLAAKAVVLAAATLAVGEVVAFATFGLVQAVLATFVFSFVILGARHGSSFLPRRDYSFFIGSVRTLHGREPSVTPLPGPEWAGEVSW